MLLRVFAGVVTVAALVAVAAVAGCSDSSGETVLSIHLENAYGVRNYTLTCDPPGGDVPSAEKMCKGLSRDADVILFTPPNKSLCAGGTFTIHVRVTGIYEGRTVDTEEADACQGNLKAERLWQSTLSIPQAPF